MIPGTAVTSEVNELFPTRFLCLLPPLPKMIKNNLVLGYIFLNFVIILYVLITAHPPGLVQEL
jgi:hypothetical protein